MAESERYRRIADAVDIADMHGQVADPIWVIDQMVRKLCGSEAAYQAWRELYAQAVIEDGRPPWRERGE